MLPEDTNFIYELIRVGLVKPPCLEVGSGVPGKNVKRLLGDFNFEYQGTDIAAGPDVDIIVDFQDKEAVEKAFCGKKFQTIFMLSVLEHVFDPIRMLDNALSVLVEGGACVIITPCVWPIHNYPEDFWRINPDFYKEYARSRQLNIVDSFFRFSTKYGRVMRMDTLPEFPLKKTWFVWSRAVHRLFNTYGRGMFFPSNVSIEVVMVKTKK